MTRASREAEPRRRRIRRVSGRVLIVLLLSAGAVTMAAPAWAISLPFIGNCKSQPVPQPPGDGVTGFFEVKPDPLPAPAPAFGQNPGSTEYVQYGYSGLYWSTYDLGCLSNPITDAGPIIDTMLGNWALGTAKTIVALDNSAHEWAADPTWTATLTPLVGGANSALYKALFLVWAGAALMTVAISVALRAHQSDMPGSLTLAVWALFVITLVSGVVAAPGWAGEQASSLMSSTLNALDAGFAGPGAQANASQAHASLTVSAILYPAWLRGEFGDPSSPAAQQYGAALFQAQALTWSQAAASPAQINATTKADQAKWGQAAAAVQKNYPQVYPDIQGTGSSRIGAGILAVLTAVIVCGYDFIASLVVIMALLGVMAGAIMLPALAVVGMHHNMRHVVIGLGSRVFGMLINGVLWAAGAGIDALVTRSLLSNALVPPTLALLILAVLPFILWMVTRVLRGRPAVPRAVRRAAMLGLGYAFLRGGARAGARAGAADAAAANPQQPAFDQEPWTWRASPLPPNAIPPGNGGGNGGPLPPPNGGGGGQLPPNGGGPRPLPPPKNPPNNGGGGGQLPPNNAGPRPLPPNNAGPRPLPPNNGGGNGGPLPPPNGGDGGQLPPNGGGPRPLPPPGNPPNNGDGGGSGGQLPPANNDSPRSGLGPAAALSPPAAAASGPREYEGPAPQPSSGTTLVPTRVYRPGEDYEDHSDLYDGGTSANGQASPSAPAAPPQPASRPHTLFDHLDRNAVPRTRRRPRPRSQWSTSLLNEPAGTPPCGTCGGSGRGGGGDDHGTICPACRGWGY